MSGKIALASLAFEIAVVGAEGTAPAEVHILPPGPFRANDGRPVEVSAWQLDASIAEKVIARIQGKKVDSLIDYEHQNLHKKQNGRPAPAAGWFRDMEWRDGVGLFAVAVRWVPKAKAMIAAGEYRYISAVFLYCPVTGKVLEILSVALTNDPALDDLEPLAALARNLAAPENHQGETEMPGEKTDATIAALTAERDAQKTAIADLTSQNKALQDQLAAIEKANADAAAAREKQERNDLIEAALSKNALLPSQRTVAEKMELPLLKEFLASQAPIADLTRQTDGKRSGEDGAHGLTKEEIAACTSHGVDLELFAKTKADMAKRSTAAPAAD